MYANLFPDTLYQFIAEELALGQTVRHSSFLDFTKTVRGWALWSSRYDEKAMMLFMIMREDFLFGEVSTLLMDRLYVFSAFFNPNFTCVNAYVSRCIVNVILFLFFGNIKIF